MSLPKQYITIDEIMKMPSESLVEKVLEFCEEYNLDISEILHLFEDKKMKELLYVSAVENNVIKDEEMKKILNERLQEWENQN